MEIGRIIKRIWIEEKSIERRYLIKIGKKMKKKGLIIGNIVGKERNKEKEMKRKEKRKEIVKMKGRNEWDKIG